MTRTISNLCIALTLAATTTHALAASAPPQLYNKTITVSFSLTSRGAPGSLAVQRLIYVSSKGRIFVRGSRSTRAASDSADVAAGAYRYEGGRIIGHYTMADHANQLTITFDPGFQSCNASLRFGKSSGKSYRTTAPGGMTTVSDTAPAVSGLSCSIRDGNPFVK